VLIFENNCIITFILNFGVRGDIADVITHVKFFVNRFICFRAVTAEIWPGISIGMADGSYNSVRMAVYTL